MPTASGHTRLILAEKVQGTDVYNQAGEHIGTVEDVVLDKLSGNVVFAVMSFGGFLGIGERYHPVPWAVLDYDEDRGGYSVPFDRQMLERAPAYDIDELTREGGNYESNVNQYYQQYGGERGAQIGQGGTMGGGMQGSTQGGMGATGGTMGGTTPPRGGGIGGTTH